MSEIGTVIRRLRERKGWTQGQLGVYSKLSKSHVNMIERGARQNPSIETIAKLALALGASVDSILIEAGLFPAPENTPWTPALLVMQRALNLYPPGSPERDHLERIVLAQAEAYIALRDMEQEQED